MSRESIVDQFARRGAELPGSDAVAGKRRSALARFSQLGFPGRKLETWRYTDLTSLQDKGFDYVGSRTDAALTGQARSAIAALELDPDVARLVFVDGCLDPTLSSHSPQNTFRIERLAEKPDSLLTDNGDEDPALAALNLAFARDGASIRFLAGESSRLNLVFFGGAPEFACQIRLRMHLEQGARAVVSEYFVDADDGAERWLNSLADIRLDEGSHLERYRLQQHGPAGIATTLGRIHLAAGAEFSSSAVETGGKLVRHELDIRLDGPGAQASVAGLALTNRHQHCDLRIAIDHRAADTRSRQDYRAIADGNSRSVFNGKVTVREGAQHIDARQRNDNLLLSPKAEIDTKPELEIYADQVACSHGATIGELDEEQMFYLQSRGIDAVTARGILTSAFATVIIQRFSLESFRARAQAAVTHCLPQAITAA